jgi:hypothetical protein
MEVGARDREGEQTSALKRQGGGGVHTCNIRERSVWRDWRGIGDRAYRM